MFKNILTIAVISAVSASAFAKGTVGRAEIGKTETKTEAKSEFKSTISDGKISDAAKDAQARLLEANASSKLAQALKAGNADILSRLSPELLAKVLGNAAKEAAVNELVQDRATFDTAQARAALIAVIQYIAVSNTFKSAATIAEQVNTYKAEKGEILKTYTRLHSFAAKAGLEGSVEPMVDAIARIRQEARTGNKLAVNMKAIASGELAIARELKNELEKNGCLVK